MIKDLLLDLSLPGWFLFILGIILFFIASVYYYKTLPPLTKFRRTILTIFRFSILFIIIFLLFQPVLQIIYEKHDLPTLAILLDNSASMKKKERSGLRADSLKYLIDHLKSQSSDSLNYKFYQFDESIKRLISDTLTFDGKQTNISRALETVADSASQLNLQAIVLVTDGRFNQGFNPLKFAEDSPLPIFTVGIGDTFPEKDIRITTVRVNPVVYSGQKTSVKVRFLQNGFESGEVAVRIRAGKKQIKARKISIPKSGFEQEIEFQIEAPQPGEFRYTVEIEPLKGESTTQNNYYSFMLKVLKSKLKTFLLSGQPSFDQKMLIYCLNQLPNIELTSLTEKGSGLYFEKNFGQVNIDSQDVFIFLGFPTSRSDNTHLQQIFAKIKKDKRPFFFFVTSNSDFGQLQSWQTLFPFKIPVKITKGQLTTVYLTTSGKLHPVTRLTNDPQQLLLFWNDLPPVFSLVTSFELKEGSQILLKRSGKNELEKYPILISYISEGIKSLIYTATGFGSWHFQLQEDPGRSNFLQMLLERALKWLTSREDLQRIQIKPNQKVYKLGETVVFSGQVLNEFYEVINDAIVEIFLQKEGYELTDLMQGSSGNYEYRVAGLAPGIYKYKIQAKEEGRSIGVASGKFVVEELELEMQETRPDFYLLREIAHRTGGSFWEVKEAIHRIAKLKWNPRVQLQNEEHVLWNKMYWMISLIILLTLEWFLRKRWGLL